jgi:hypothetical protein
MGSNRVHIITPVSIDLPPQPPMADEDLDHTEYKNVLTAVMSLKEDALLESHREKTRKLVNGLEANIDNLRKELKHEREHQDQQWEDVVAHVKELQAMFGQDPSVL